MIELPYKGLELKEQGKPASQETWQRRIESLTHYLKEKKADIAGAQLYLTQRKTQTASNGGDDKSDAYREEKTEKQVLKDSLPSLVDYAVMADIDQVTIRTWGSENEDYQALLMSLKDLGEHAVNRAVDLGLVDNIFGKFLLSARYDYREKTEQDITSGGEKISINFDNAFAPNTKDSSE